MEENNKTSTSNNKPGLGWVSLGAGLAGLSVLLGAFGAHSLKAQLTEKKLATFHTATDYLGYHALGLIAIGILMLVEVLLFSSITFNNVIFHCHRPHGRASRLY